MFMLADGSSSTQSRFDLMVEVLNAETAISEIGRALVFIRKELGSGSLNGKPICLFRLHLFSRHLRQTCWPDKNAGSNFAGNVLLGKTEFAHGPDLSCFAKVPTAGYIGAGAGGKNW